MAKWLRTAAAALAFIEPAGAADSFLDLQAAYRCEVVHRLELIMQRAIPAVTEIVIW